MSSLRCSDGSSQHYAQLGLSLKMGAVLKIQLAAQLERGILRPNIQLISVTPTFDVCVEHRRCAGRCFVKRNGVKAEKSEYSSVEEYRYSLLSIIVVDHILIADINQHQVSFYSVLDKRVQRY